MRYAGCGYAAALRLASSGGGGGDSVMAAALAYVDSCGNAGGRGCGVTNNGVGESGGWQVRRYGGRRRQRRRFSKPALLPTAAITCGGKWRQMLPCVTEAAASCGGGRLRRLLRRQYGGWRRAFAGSRGRKLPGDPAGSGDPEAPNTRKPGPGAAFGGISKITRRRPARVPAYKCPAK